MANTPLDPELRKKLLLGAVLVAALGYAAWTYAVAPRRVEVAELQTRLANVQLQNTTARALTKGSATDEVERQLALYRDQLQAVEGLIPSAEEVPDLLDAISLEAQRTGVEMALIQPVGATQETYYTRSTYDMAVLGTYHQIGAFLSRVASLPRIVTPVNLILTPRDEPAEGGRSGAAQRLEARFSIETYVIPTEQPTDAASAD